MSSGSRALKIVRPPQAATAAVAVDGNSTPTSSLPSGQSASTLQVAGGDAPTSKLCKNIAIYGHCKFADKGCVFSHDVEAAKKPSGILSAAASDYVFTPASSRPTTPASSTGSALQAAAASASVFVPKVTASKFASPRIDQQATQASPNAAVEAQSTNLDEANVGLPLQPAALQLPAPTDEFDEFNPYATPASSHAQLLSEQGYYGSDAGLNYQDPMAGSEYGYAAMGVPPPDLGHNPYLSQDTGVNGFGQPYTTYVRQPLQYHMYQPAQPTPTPAANPHLLIAQNFFMSPTLREDLQRRMEATAQLPTHKLAADGELGQYWGLIPLDKRMPDQVPQQGLRLDQQGRAISGSGVSGAFRYRSWIYKCTSAEDGNHYALRRIEGFRIAQEAAIAAVDVWSRVQHPAIVNVREAFTTKAFGDNSLIFVYEFFPLASTLLETYLCQPVRGAPQPPLISERVLWSYLVQIASAMQAVHSAGLAIRCLDPSKILITGQNRIRLSACSIMDVLAFDGGQGLPSHQQDDLLALGRLIVTLASLSLAAFHNLSSAMDHIGHVYSQDFHKAIMYLLSKPNPRKSIDDFLGLIRVHLVEELNSSLTQTDSLENELCKEVENGRLVRLMAKFGFINERPSYDHDARWAETGDRYIIKLFRDYVFHQIDDRGRPVVDLSHVLTCLNKLDAGVDEQLALVSRDEQSCLIVSYREIKNCLESSFRELVR